MNIFSSRLISLRKEKGITQEDLAKALYKKRSTISGYETEGKEPDFQTLGELAKYFSVSVDYLLGFSECRSNTDDVLFRDNVNFKKHYAALPPELKQMVALMYDDFYVLLNRDLQTANSGRLAVYAEMFKELRQTRSEIKLLIENYNDEAQDPLFLSSLMTKQNNLKNTISSLLDRLMQEDMNSNVPAPMMFRAARSNSHTEPTVEKADDKLFSRLASAPAVTDENDLK